MFILSVSIALGGFSGSNVLVFVYPFYQPRILRLDGFFQTYMERCSKVLLNQQVTVSDCLFDS